MTQSFMTQSFHKPPNNPPGGVLRIKFLWKDALIVTDPQALAIIMGRGEGALDKASGVYATINYM